eukprot:gene25547-11191_t
MTELPGIRMCSSEERGGIQNGIKDKRDGAAKSKISKSQKSHGLPWWQGLRDGQRISVAMPKLERCRTVEQRGKMNRTQELKRSLLPASLQLFDSNMLKENMLSSFFPAQVFAGGRVTGGYSGVKKSKPEPEVEVLRKALLCLTEAIVSKNAEISELKLKLNNEAGENRLDALEVQELLDNQGQVIEQQQEQIMLLEATVARLRPSMMTKESQTESLEEEVKIKTAEHDAFSQTTVCMGVQEMACQTEAADEVEESAVGAVKVEVGEDACCQTIDLAVQKMVCQTEADTNPDTTLATHEAGRQTEAGTIIRSAATPERQEMSCQADFEHVRQASVQIVARQSACLVQSTSQAPLGLPAVQSGLTDVNELASLKINVGIHKKMHPVAERLFKVLEKSAQVECVKEEQGALANMCCSLARMFKTNRDLETVKNRKMVTHLEGLMMNHS